MGKLTIMSPEEAVQLIQDDSTLAISSFLSYTLPESLLRALGERYEKTGHPRNLTTWSTAPVGINDGSGYEHLAQKGMLKRVVAAHWNLHPKLRALATANEIEAYNLPQGPMSRMTREMAAGGPGILTHVGLGTFADPRQQGGKMNDACSEDLVELINFNGKELLFYKPVPFDAAFIRGTYADTDGNISVEKEGVSVDVVSMAQAAHNNGGIVIVQVEKIVAAGTLDPWKVKIPGVLVDAVVLAAKPEDQVQCRARDYDGSITGELRLPEVAAEPMAMGPKRIIGRRAAMELKKNIAVNLGIGIASCVGSVTREEGYEGIMTLTVEAGSTGGSPLHGDAFGGNVNVNMIMDQPYMFDFYDGGGLAQCFLGFGQIDKEGNVNAHKFGDRIAGCGGFVDISQGAKKVTFCGTFSSGGLEVATGDGQLRIVKEGRNSKFKEHVDQITFSAKYAAEHGQDVHYVTERAVFTLTKDGLMLTEIAPGVDLQKDILDQMSFRPLIADSLKLMDTKLFCTEKCGLVIE